MCSLEAYEDDYDCWVDALFEVVISPEGLTCAGAQTVLCEETYGYRDHDGGHDEEAVLHPS